MYIMVGAWRWPNCDFSSCYCYAIFAGNNVRLCDSHDKWREKKEAVKAAKRIAKKLNIDYRENKNG